MPDYTRTKITLTDEQLREMWGEDEAPGFSPVKACPGVWRLEPDGSYRFWREDNS